MFKFRGCVISALLVTEEYDTFMKKHGAGIDPLKTSSPSPRHLKSHLPIGLLPAQLDTIKPKIIYIARDPKDTCVSYYHYLQLVHNLNCQFDTFCDLLLNDMVPVGPLWPHYLSFWNRRHEPNILFLKYEDMIRDLKDVIKQTSDFLEKPLNKIDVEKLYDHLQFTNMKNNRAVNIKPILEYTPKENESGSDFIRSGKIGDWKNYMSAEMSAKFDDWIAKNTSGTGLSF